MGWHKTACRCSLSGPSKCEECGHECAPWYQGLEIPGKESLSGWLYDFTESNKYPATKGALVAYLRENSSEDADWLSENLPDRNFDDPGDVMLALTPTIESSGDQMVTKTSMRAIASGTKLAVHKGQAAVMVEPRSNSALDVLLNGTYVLSASNCPMLAAKSRRPAESFDKMVLMGGPVFISLEKELQLPFIAMGQTASGKPGGAKGTIRVSVQGPKEFASFVFSSLRSGYDDASLAAALTSRFTTALRTALATTQMDAMKKDYGVLGGPLSESAGQIGLKATVSIEYAGEPTPELSMAMMGQTMGDMSAKMAAAQQAMRMAQQRPGMPGGQVPQPYPAGPPRSPQPAATICPKCNFKNPPGVKFCNNCGTPMGMKKCQQCGTENNPSVNFCGNCGSKL
jgi:hypothetical protein